MAFSTSKLSKMTSRFHLAAGGQNKTLENDAVSFVLLSISCQLDLILFSEIALKLPQSKIDPLN